MKPDSTSLALKADECLQVARELFAGGHYDFSAGRAYYAMFYLSEATLLERGKTFSSHHGVLAGFFHEFVEPELIDRSHHQSLVRGFELRQAGDYGGFASVSKEQCEDLLERAARFFGAVRLMLEQSQ